MTCPKLPNLTFDYKKVSRLIETKYPTVGDFLQEYCLSRTSYYRWMSGRGQPQLGFYVLLVGIFGGDILSYTRKGGK